MAGSEKTTDEPSVFWTANSLSNTSTTLRSLVSKLSKHLQCDESLSDVVTALPLERIVSTVCFGKWQEPSSPFTLADFERLLLRCGPLKLLLNKLASFCD